VSVAYGSEIDLVVEVLMAVAHDHRHTLDHPAARVRLREFRDSGLEFELLCWIARPADRGRILHELNTDIYNRFEPNAAKIPVPQREVVVGDAGNVDIALSPAESEPPE
jgi:MscS family membrane protein